jgi:hypothetical protein
MVDFDGEDVGVVGDVSEWYWGFGGARWKFVVSLEK